MSSAPEVGGGCTSDATAEYSGSNIHRESVQLLESIGASPSKKQVDADTLKRHLSRIVIDNAGKDLTLTDAREKLEQLLGISLADRRSEVRRLLWKLCSDYVEGKLTDATLAAEVEVKEEEAKEKVKQSPNKNQVVMDLVDDDDDDDDDGEGENNSNASQTKSSGTPSKGKGKTKQTPKKLRVESTKTKNKSSSAKTEASGSIKSDLKGEPATQPNRQHFQRAKQGEDVRHQHLDVAGAVPISFPKQFSKSMTPVLVELDRGGVETDETAGGGGSKKTVGKKGDEHLLDLRGDTGSIGRLAVVRPKTVGVSNTGSAASEVRLDLKGRVFHGRMSHLRNTVLMVSVVGNDARVEAAFDSCLFAQYDRNVLDDLHGAVVHGTIEKSAQYEGDINVNDGGDDENGVAANKKDNTKKRTGNKKATGRRPAKKKK